VEPSSRELRLEEGAYSAAIVRAKLGSEHATVGEAEINQPHAPVVQDERVPRMNVAMQHPSLVDRGICVEQTACQLECAARVSAREKRMP
jgi:hypothetical protein